MSEFVAWLDQKSAAQVSKVGGKASSLARLAQAGFPVPPGFAVTAFGYQHFHASSGLNPLIEPFAGLDARPAIAAVNEAAASLGARLAEAQIPSDLADAVRSSFAELKARAGEGDTFAVRSSAVSEDSTKASFAGLYESYLNLASADEVLESLMLCYKSLWEPRAIQYRAIKGVPNEGEAMAVVVMATILSASSGVAFSLNPMTGADDEVTINSTWGLGEAVVSGIVTPDTFTVGKDGTPRAREISEKHIRVVPTTGGTAREDTPSDIALKSSLTEEQVTTVVNATVAVEGLYGTKVDIEFAFNGEGKFFLLQARPVTTH